MCALTSPVRLPRTHVTLRAVIAFVTLVIVVALCRWAVSDGRGSALVDWEMGMVRHAWREAISLLRPIWESLDRQSPQILTRA